MNIVKAKVCEAIDRFYIKHLGKKGKVEAHFNGQDFTIVKEVFENAEEISKDGQKETKKTYQQ
jgi:hypothetical protein